MADGVAGCADDDELVQDRVAILEEVGGFDGVGDCFAEQADELDADAPFRNPLREPAAEAGLSCFAREPRSFGMVVVDAASGFELNRASARGVVVVPMGDEKGADVVGAVPYRDEVPARAGRGKKDTKGESDSEAL
jgi:hypothetical protein